MGISIIKTVELHPIIYILHKGYINFQDDSFSLRKKHNKAKQLVLNHLAPTGKQVLDLQLKGRSIQSVLTCLIIGREKHGKVEKPMKRE